MLMHEHVGLPTIHLYTNGYQIYFPSNKLKATTIQSAHNLYWKKQQIRQDVPEILSK